MTDIHKKNLGYSLLKNYVNWCVKFSYGHIQVQGVENIPKDGAVILAANHCNTLMDALVILRANPGVTVFGARADIFKKPSVARILHFLRMLPMVRERDGIRNVVKNFDTMDMVAEAIDGGAAFCFFPEGTHRPRHSLLPIRKGLTRLAMVADEKLDPSKPLYFVPVGLEYGDYFRYRSSSLVTFGKPVELRSILHSSEDKDAVFFRSCSGIYASAISQLITYIPDDDNYDGVWAMTKILQADKHNVLPSANLEKNRATVDRIHSKMETHPEETAALLEDARRFDLDRKDAGVSFTSFNFGSRTSRMLLSPVWFLALAVSGIVTLPLWMTSEYLCSKVFKDKAFSNTARFVVMFLYVPIYLLVNLLLWFLIPSWAIRILILVVSLCGYPLFYSALERVRVFLSDVRLTRNKGIGDRFKELRSRFEAII